MRGPACEARTACPCSPTDRQARNGDRRTSPRRAAAPYRFRAATARSGPAGLPAVRCGAWSFADPPEAVVVIVGVVVLAAGRRVALGAASGDDPPCSAVPRVRGLHSVFGV